MVNDWSFADYLRILRRRWWLLVLLPALAFLATSWLLARREPTYTTSSTLLVSPGTSPDSALSSELNAVGLITQTYGELATSPPVLDRARATLGLPPGTDLQVSATAGIETQLIELSATAPDPRLAARIADGVAQEFTTWLADLQSEASSESSLALQQSIDRTRADLSRTTAAIEDIRNRPGVRTASETARLSDLEDVRVQYESTYTGLLELEQRLEQQQLAYQNRVKLVAPARIPENPSGLPAAVYLAISLVLGIGLAGLGVILLERIGNHVYGAAHVERQTSLPVLAQMPEWRANSSSRDGSSLVEARHDDPMHSLRSFLELADRAGDGQTLVVASPGRDEGKSLVCARLARSFAQAGRRTVLIDGNLRYPQQHVLFDVANARGLSDLLVERHLNPDEVLIDTSIPTLQLILSGPWVVSPGELTTAHRRATGSLHSLWGGRGRRELVLAMGDGGNGFIIDNVDSTSDLLTRSRLEQIRDALRGRFDVIIIDTPSVLDTPDALFLTAVSDRAIVVARSGRTRLDDLNAAVTALKRNTVSIAGVALTAADSGRV